jgi:hypothetical protein
VEFAQLCDEYGILAFKPPGNPKELVEDFVTRFYQLCLGRNPDPAGLNGWATALLDGSQAGSDVAHGFVFSQEFINQNTTNEEYLTVLYEAFFNRQPDLAGWQGWMDALIRGSSREAVLNGFIFATEFIELCDEYKILPFDPLKRDDDGDGFAEFAGDCNDRDPNIHPAANEICGDGIDQDCDGSDLLCSACTNIAGNWYGSETITITCCLGGDCETDTFSGTDTVTIQQNECNFSYDIDVGGYGTYTRTGTINANKIQLSGLFVILQPWCNARQNIIDINGTVIGDQMNLQGSGRVNGTCDGDSFSCTGDSTATLSRLSSSATSKAMIGKESNREFTTPLLNNCIKIFTILDH